MYAESESATPCGAKCGDLGRVNTLRSSWPAEDAVEPVGAMESIGAKDTVGAQLCDKADLRAHTMPSDLQGLKCEA